MGFLNNDSIFGRVFGFLGQLIALNLLWILCSLPLITAGASTTALYYCVLKLHKDKEVNVFRDFFKSFRQNFKQATFLWLVAAAVAGFLFWERDAIASLPGLMPQIFSLAAAAVCIPLVLTFLYLFPTLAAFENKAVVLVKTAFYFALKNIGFAIAISVITILPMVMTLVDAKMFPIYLLIWLMLGFSLTAYGNAWFLWKLFRPYFTEREETPCKESGTDQYAF